MDENSSTDFAALRRRILARYGNVGVWRKETRRKLEQHGISRTELTQRAGFARTSYAVSRWLRETDPVTPALKSMLIVDEALDELIKERE